MQLLLIRHGESVANRQRILQGHLDSPLNETGREQAALLSESLAEDRFAAIFSSDLARARETAQTVADRLGTSVIQDPDLREIGIGIFTGMSWSDISERYPEEHQRLVASGMDWTVVPGAEGEAAARVRLERFLSKIRAEHGDERLALVAHGAILRRMIRLLLGFPSELTIDFELSNASCTEIHQTPRGTRLLYANRVPYPSSSVRVGDSPRLLV